MNSQHSNMLSDADRALHALRVYIHLYGQDFDKLIGQLRATAPGSSWNELYRCHGLHLAPERIVYHLENIIRGLDNLPLHLLLDDGAFQPPYKTVAYRAEANWHREALAEISRRLSAVPPTSPD